MEYQKTARWKFLHIRNYPQCRGWMKLVGAVDFGEIMVLLNIICHFSNYQNQTFSVGHDEFNCHL